MPLAHISTSLVTTDQRLAERTLVQCFIANQEALKSYFRRAVSENADAEDLFQKLLVKALKLEGDLRIDNPLAYGYRMAHHLLIDHYREQQKAPASLDYEPPSEALSLENVLDHEQRMELYRQVLEEMSVMRREIFIRRRLHEESRQQIAQTLGLTEEAVKKHLTRAMEMLKKAMASHVSKTNCPRSRD